MVRLFKRHLSSKRGLASTEMLKSRNPAIQIPGAKTASAHMVFILRKKVEVFAAEVFRNHEVNCNHLNQFCNTKKLKKCAPELSVIWFWGGFWGGFFCGRFWNWKKRP